MPGRAHTRLYRKFLRCCCWFFFISFEFAVCYFCCLAGCSYAVDERCVCVRALSVGVDFHSIVTIRRLEFNLNEMWQMGKNVEFEAARERAPWVNVVEVLPKSIHIFSSLSLFPSVANIGYASVIFVVSPLSLSFFRWLLADIPRWSASLHTIYASTYQANKLFVLLFVVPLFFGKNVELNTYVEKERQTERSKRFMCVVWVRAKRTGYTVERRNKKETQHFLCNKVRTITWRAYIKKKQ